MIAAAVPSDLRQRNRGRCVVPHSGGERNNEQLKRSGCIVLAA